MTTLASHNISQPQSNPQAVALRHDPVAADVHAVRGIVESTSFFSAAEVDVAIELLDDRLSKGENSEYRFIFADIAAKPVGFASFGEIACTIESWDLYWIAVTLQHQSTGIGQLLLGEAERLIANSGGRRIYVETSSRSQYEPTLGFYHRCGYHIAATLDDFYAPGDGKIILVKVLA